MQNEDITNLNLEFKPSFESLSLLPPVAFASSACPINAFQLFFFYATSVPLLPVKDQTYNKIVY